jgi:hypothetical protein
MNSVFGLFLAILSIALVYTVVCVIASNMTFVTSTVDEHVYKVRNLPDKQAAADLLATIRRRLDRLTHKLRAHYKKDSRVSMLTKRFESKNISEVAAHSKLTSYSVNKGEKIIFCLRSRDGEDTLVDLNTIMFVALHELAHVMTISVGHTKEFWENFRFLLSHAIHWKLYVPVDFKETPVPYCGTNITDTPLQLDEMPKYVGHLNKIDEEADVGFYT